MCTSKGDRKMLIRVGAFASVAGDSIRVTRPSAGDTTTFRSFGGTRFGSRKKNAMNSATKKNSRPTYHSPKAVVATLTTSGTTMYGILSRTILKPFSIADCRLSIEYEAQQPAFKSAIDNRKSAIPFLSYIKKGRVLLVPRPFNLVRRNCRRAVSVTQTL